MPAAFDRGVLSLVPRQPVRQAIVSSQSENLVSVWPPHLPSCAPSPPALATATCRFIDDLKLLYADHVGPRGFGVLGRHLLLAGGPETGRLLVCSTASPETLNKRDFWHLRHRPY